MVQFNVGTWVWLPHPSECYLPVQLHSRTSNTVTAVSSDEEQFDFPATILPSLDAIPHTEALTAEAALSHHNLTNLPQLTSSSILHTLRHRYNQGSIYSSISSLLLSINPYKPLPIYGPNAIQQYHHSLSNREEQTKNALPPHVYGLAHNAYARLCEGEGNQSIIISGESGSGKTEATKLILQYIADISHATQPNPAHAAQQPNTNNTSNSDNQSDSASGSGSGIDDISQQILAANPLLEAFGNARTQRNNNSSRFGRFIQVIFDSRRKIIGSKIISYLLEKNRVITQANGEANFHIFLAICTGANDEERANYHIQPPSYYQILATSDQTVPEISLSEVKTALSTLDFSREQIDGIFRVLSAILHLGNVKFQENDTANTGVNITNRPETIDIAGRMLGIPSAELELALLTRKLLVGGEVITQKHTAIQCQDMTNSLMKGLYEALFSYLITAINTTLAPADTAKDDGANSSSSSSSSSNSTIGILDIFGFESFPLNYWEQFCINWANEKLQYFFIQECLLMEQIEYEQEGINIEKVSFNDNLHVIDLIETKKRGIVDLIAEELKMPKHSDSTLLTRFHSTFTDSSASALPASIKSTYIKPKTSEPIFTVKHYAGDVIYRIEGTLEKNKGENLTENIYSVFEESSNIFVSELLLANCTRRTSSSSSTTNSSATAGTGSTSNSFRSTGKFSQTVASIFKQDLQNLLTSLSETTPHFLKCIKPNDSKVPDYFDSNFVMKQLNYLGVRECIEVRKKGFNVRIRHLDFIRRYPGILNKQQILTGNHQANEIIIKNYFEACKRPDIDGTSWKYGKTKILMKNHVQSLLEDIREKKILKGIRAVQSQFRCKRLRKYFQEKLLLFREIKQILEKEKGKTLIEPNNSALDQLNTLLSNPLIDDLPVSLVSQASNIRNRLNDSVLALKTLAAAMLNGDISLIAAALVTCQNLNITANQNPQVEKAHNFVKAVNEYESQLNQLLAADVKADAATLTRLLGQGAAMNRSTSLEMRGGLLLKKISSHSTLRNKIELLLSNSNNQQIKMESLAALIKEGETLEYDPIVLNQMKARMKLIEEEQKRLNKEREESLDRAEALKREQMNDLNRQISDALLSSNLHHITSLLSYIQQILSSSPSLASITNSPLYANLLAHNTLLMSHTTALERALESESEEQMNLALTEAVTAGVEELEAVMAVKKELNERKLEREMKEMVKVACESRQESILLSVKERIEERRGKFSNANTNNPTAANGIGGLSISTSGPKKKAYGTYGSLLIQLNTVLEELKLEDLMRAQDQAAQASTVFNGDLSGPAASTAAIQSSMAHSNANAGYARSASAASNPHLNGTVNGLPSAAAGAGGAGVTSSRTFLRVNEPFDDTPFLSPIYALHLYPNLRTLDDYTKGKWLGKEKIKKSMLVWNKEIIPKSLTKLDQVTAGTAGATSIGTGTGAPAGVPLNHVAITLFKNLQGWMTDRVYSFPDSLAYDFLTTMLDRKEMRDEGYVQVIKQLRENNKRESIIRGLQLLGMMSECFHPSQTFLPFLYHFLLTSSLRSTPMYLNYLNFTLHTLTHNVPTLKLPALSTITTFRDKVMSTLILPLYFPDGTSLSIEVSPEVKVAGLIANIGKFLNCDLSTKSTSDCYGIYMCSTNTLSELCLGQEECLLDFPASNCTDHSLYFLFKQRMFIPFAPTPYADSIHSIAANGTSSTSPNPLLESLVYHQCLLDACHGVYDLRREELIEILAIHRALHTEKYFLAIGKEDPLITKGIKEIRPLAFSFWELKEIERFEAEVDAKMNGYLKQTSTATRPSPLKVYNLLSKRKEFSASLFQVSQDEREEFPPSLLVAVNTFGICLLNENTKSLITALKFSQITGWASNSVRFCLRVLVNKSGSNQSTASGGTPAGNTSTGTVAGASPGTSPSTAAGRTVQLNFRTNQGKRIVRVVQEYVAFLMRKMEEDKETIYSRNSTSISMSTSSRSTAVSGTGTISNSAEKKAEEEKENVADLVNKTIITVL